MKRGLLAALLFVLAACGQEDTSNDVPPLPRPTSETANELMAEAERAAANAQHRMEQTAAPERSIPAQPEVRK